MLIVIRDLADEGMVRLIAEEVARRLGEVITVTDDDGDEVLDGDEEADEGEDNDEMT